jgi:hypothetical protein
MEAWLWQALFILSVVEGFVAVQLAIREERKTMRFVAMDSRDTFYLANLGTFEDSQHIHAELAKMAAETIYSRSPDGFDNPERLERLFNPATFDSIKIAERKESEAYKAQQIHQKIETGQIKEISIDDKTALVSVEGQLLRTGVFNGRIQNDTKKVTLFLKLTVNNDMAHNGRYPLVVTNYNERFE